MITLTAEYKTNTFLGITNCETVKYVFARPRDIETVEDVIKWVKKLFKNGSDPMITFGYFVDSQYSVSRLFKDWKDGKECIRQITWGNYNGYTEEYHEKLTTRIIKKLYLETADKNIEAEEEKKAREGA